MMMGHSIFAAILTRYTPQPLTQLPQPHHLAFYFWTPGTQEGVFFQTQDEKECKHLRRLPPSSCSLQSSFHFSLEKIKRIGTVGRIWRATLTFTPQNCSRRTGKLGYEVLQHSQLLFLHRLSMHRVKDTRAEDHKRRGKALDVKNPPRAKYSISISHL